MGRGKDRKFAQSQPINSNLVREGRLPDRSWSAEPRQVFAGTVPIFKPSNYVGSATTNYPGTNGDRGPTLNPFQPYGPGHCNKYAPLNNAPTLVKFRPLYGPDHNRDGRDLWTNYTNPYQFDQLQLRRAENLSKDIAFKQESDKV